MNQNRIFVSCSIPDEAVETCFHLEDKDGELCSYTVLVNKLRFSNGSRLITFINENGDIFTEIGIGHYCTEPMKIKIQGQEAYLVVMKGGEESDYYTVVIDSEMTVKTA